jgi:hypothetical protein
MVAPSGEIAGYLSQSGFISGPRDAFWAEMLPANRLNQNAETNRKKSIP